MKRPVWTIHAAGFSAVIALTFGLPLIGTPERLTGFILAWVIFMHLEWAEREAERTKKRRIAGSGLR